MANLQEELARVVEFNQLMERKIGDPEHIYLQAQLLVQEGITELAEACFKKDRTMLRDAMADTSVVAMGGYYIAGGKDTPMTTLLGDCLGDVICYVGDTITAVANDNYDVKSGFETVIDAVTGFALAEGVDIAADLKAVNDSNLSKFCLTITEGIATKREYLAKYNLKSELKETGNERYPYAVYSAEDSGDFLKGKLLKSINYQAPQFEAES